MQPESRFKHALVAGFTRCFPKPASWYSYLVKGPGMPGLVFRPVGHRLFWVEAKTAEGYLSEVQHRVCQQLTDGGELVWIFQEEKTRFLAHPYPHGCQREFGKPRSLTKAAWLSFTEKVAA